MSPLLLLAASWAAYAVLHSALALARTRQWIERTWPKITSRYRLLYNAIAVALLVPPLWLTASLRGPWLWRWTAPWSWFADALALLALAGFAVSLNYYDIGEFLGLRLPKGQPSGGGFVMSPFHRFVRHPWYFFSLVILWSRSMDGARLITASVLTLYLIVGSSWEDRKLDSEYGELYRPYKAAVPGLFPWLTRFLSGEEARALQGEEPG